VTALSPPSGRIVGMALLAKMIVLPWSATATLAVLFLGILALLLYRYLRMAP
jgi:hypothetical protein